MSFRDFLNEGKFKFKNKTFLNQTINKNKGKFLTWSDDGEWEFTDELADVNSIAVQDVLDYYGWRYNVKTSISVALKDLEKGAFEKDEVGRD